MIDADHQFFYMSTTLDPDIMKKSGRILLTAELGREYGFKDVGGESIWGFRACLHGGEGRLVGEVTRLGGVTRLSI